MAKKTFIAGNTTSDYIKLDVFCNIYLPNGNFSPSIPIASKIDIGKSADAYADVPDSMLSIIFYWKDQITTRSRVARMAIIPCNSSSGWTTAVINWEKYFNVDQWYETYLAGTGNSRKLKKLF